MLSYPIPAWHDLIALSNWLTGAPPHVVFWLAPALTHVPAVGALWDEADLVIVAGMRLGDGRDQLKGKYDRMRRICRLILGSLLAQQSMNFLLGELTEDAHRRRVAGEVRLCDPVVREQHLARVGDRHLPRELAAALGRDLVEGLRPLPVVVGAL